MKKLLAVTLSILMTLGVMSSNVLAEEKIAFSDISGHWAEKQIERIADKGIISGYPDGTFKPDAPITRAEFAKIASVAFNLEGKAPLSVFNDLDSNAWYYPYIEKTATYIPKYKLPVDYPCMQPYENNANGGFLPNSEAIRMHIAEALVLIKTEKISIDIPHINIIQQELLTKFNDADYEELFVMHGEVPANVKRMFEYTWLASELGIMQGDDKGNFNPYGYVTRAELVTMIDRMIVEGSGTPLFCDYSELFDMKLDDIETMEIQNGTTGEIIKINSRESIENVFKFISECSYKTDVRSGNYGGWRYAVSMLSKDGERIFQYTLYTGIKVNDVDYLMEDDKNEFIKIIDEIYTNAK